MEIIQRENEDGWWVAYGEQIIKGPFTHAKQAEEWVEKHPMHKKDSMPQPLTK